MARWLRRRIPAARYVLGLSLLGLSQPATAQVPPGYDFDFVTIGAPGNPAFDGFDPNGFVRGRGSVPYEYRMAREEISTSQWLEFFNTFAAREGGPRVNPPLIWGATIDTGYSGPGVRWMLTPGFEDLAARVPIVGIDWRDAARYCNWLENDKSSDLSAIQNGAYDTSTFGERPDGSITDQVAHNPSARYWIPTFDEWMKAAHFDSNRFGPDQGGYWLYDNSSDTAPIPGDPGVGETSGGWPGVPGGPTPHDIPLGAYPLTQTPWGLLDMTGGSSEWTESMYLDRWRRVEGAGVGYASSTELDSIMRFFTMQPNDRSRATLRIASAVPAPSGAVVFVILLFHRHSRRPANAHAAPHHSNSCHFSSPCPGSSRARG